MTVKAILTAPARGVKQLAQILFQSAPSMWFGLPSLGRGYAAEVGDGTSSSTVMAPLLWIARTFPEAPPALWRRNDTGQNEQILDHPMLRLLQRPNPHFTGERLWMATITDWNTSGDAYWLKRREKSTGIVKELWWAPSWMIEPYGDESTFITHYEYRPGGRVVELAPEEVVHFRFGSNPENPLKGYSPLKSVMSEVFTDDEAARFTASLLRNMGVPGIVISPDSDVPIQPEEMARTKAFLESEFTGERRGKPLVMSGRTKIEQFGFSPEQLMLRELRRIPEERVSAVLGVPAIVAGLGAGLDRSTFTNMGEAREMAYESNIIPTQRILAADIRFQLLAEFVSAEDLWALRFGFDLSEVRTLQEDEDRRWRRIDMGIRGGWITVGSGKRDTGQEVLPGDDVYLRPLNVQAVAADGSTPPLALNPGSNGHATSDEIAQAVVRELALSGN